MIRNGSNYNLLNCLAAILLCHFISLTFLSQSTSSSVHLEDRIANLELENKQQTEQIHFLKVEASENRNAIRQMENTLKELELKIDATNDDSSKSNIDEVNSVSSTWKHQNKRPARLLPLQLFNNYKVNQTEDEVIVPSNCSDLNKLGHTLSGIFLVKGEKNPKVDVVFCNFQPPKQQQASFTFGLLDKTNSETVIENRIGYVDVKSSSGVYFYVISQHGKVEDSGTLLFDKIFLNIGNAMDSSTGVFTAPKAGIYHFSFSVLKEGYALEALFVHLRLNGNKLGVVVSGDGLFASQSSLQSTLKLKKGDRIDVWKAKGKVHDAVQRSNHFTGWLLEEYLEKIN